MLNNKWAAYFWDNGVFLVLGHIMARAKSIKLLFGNFECLITTWEKQREI